VAFFGYFLSPWKESSLRPQAQHPPAGGKKKETAEAVSFFVNLEAGSN
jgi:hypothetical protein